MCWSRRIKACTGLIRIPVALKFPFRPMANVGAKVCVSLNTSTATWRLVLHFDVQSLAGCVSHIGTVSVMNYRPRSMNLSEWPNYLVSTFQCMRASAVHYCLVHVRVRMVYVVTGFSMLTCRAIRWRQGDWRHSTCPVSKCRLRQ